MKEMFYGVAGDGTYEHVGSGFLDGGTVVTARVQPRPLAPAGFGRKAAFGPVVTVVRHDGACRLTITPVIDGRTRSDLARTVDFGATETLYRDEPVRADIADNVAWADGKNNRQALLGTLGTVRFELQPLEAVTINPAGDDNALTFVGKGFTGGTISVVLFDSIGNDVPLSVDVNDGTQIQVTLATNSDSEVISTAAEVKAAIEAHGAASALVDVIIRDDDGVARQDYPAGSGAGVVAGAAEAFLEAGVVYALGGCELGTRPVGVSGRTVTA